jgi:hypothetical protein
LLQKPYEKKQFSIPHNTKKDSCPERSELEKILNLDNFSTPWNSLNATTDDIEWKTLLVSSNFSNDHKSDARQIASFFKELFEYTKIGKFDYYHRAGKTTYSCVHNYEQNEGKIIQKFLCDVINKELEISNIHIISKESRVSLIFR